jgi:glycosyltransferase involved in cell wall biosynthesis
MTRINDVKALNAYLAVDDLRVGGIQRLVLDEAYALSESGYSVKIINFGAARENDSIIHVDNMTESQLNGLSIFITSIATTRASRLKELRSFIKENDVESIICHSPSTSFWFRLAALSKLRRIKISLWIHQVLTLSDSVQAIKRVILSTTANRIFFSAVQFKLEWESNAADRVIRKLRGKQHRVVDRLGVHIPRVLRTTDSLACDSNATHAIYASRLTPWKGLDKFDQIIERNPSYHSVILTVNLPADRSPSIVSSKKITEHLVICKSPSYLSNLDKAIHIYPTYYGEKVLNPQSIGLNVMEFALLGIPSLVSPEVISTYPELLDSTLVEFVDWSDVELVDSKIQSLANLTKNERITESRNIQGVCSIQNHITTLKCNL